MPATRGVNGGGMKGYIPKHFSMGCLASHPHFKAIVMMGKEGKSIAVLKK